MDGFNTGEDAIGVQEDMPEDAPHARQNVRGIPGQQRQPAGSTLWNRITELEQALAASELRNNALASQAERLAAQTKQRQTQLPGHPVEVPRRISDDKLLRTSESWTAGRTNEVWPVLYTQPTEAQVQLEAKPEEDQHSGDNHMGLGFNSLALNVEGKHQADISLVPTDAKQFVDESHEAPDEPSRDASEHTGAVDSHQATRHYQFVPVGMPFQSFSPRSMTPMRGKEITQQSWVTPIREAPVPLTFGAVASPVHPQPLPRRRSIDAQFAQQRTGAGDARGSRVTDNAARGRINDNHAHAARRDKLHLLAARLDGRSRSPVIAEVHKSYSSHKHTNIGLETTNRLRDLSDSLRRGARSVSSSPSRGARHRPLSPAVPPTALLESGKARPLPSEHILPSNYRDASPVHITQQPRQVASPLPLFSENTSKHALRPQEPAARKLSPHARAPVQEILPLSQPMFQADASWLVHMMDQYKELQIVYDSYYRHHARQMLTGSSTTPMTLTAFREAPKVHNGLLPRSNLDPDISHDYAYWRPASFQHLRAPAFSTLHHNTAFAMQDAIAQLAKDRAGVAVADLQTTARRRYGY
jgi:hypothetical protein